MPEIPVTPTSTRGAGGAPAPATVGPGEPFADGTKFTDGTGWLPISG